MKGKRRLRGGHASFLTRTVCLALFFISGVILGQVLASNVPDSAGQELIAYLQNFFSLESRISGSVVISTLILYFRYPVLAVLLGFSSIGVLLLPLITAIFGFFLSFSICCFTATFGSGGILLALAIFGIRCLISLPCFFLVAVPAWETSAALASASFGKGRRTTPIHYGRIWWHRVMFCATGLLVGTIFELFCSPWLLRLVLDRILV